MEKEEKTTPMLVQYQEIHAEYPGYILFFRLGDFYEMFADDAEKMSKELELHGQACLCAVYLTMPACLI